MRTRILLPALVLCAISWGTTLGNPPSTQPSGGSEAGAAPQKDIVDRLEARLEAQENQEADLQNEISQVTVQLRRSTGRIEVSPDIFHTAAGKLDDKLEDLSLDEVAGKARMDAITRAIAQIAKNTATAADNDPVVIELQKVADAHQRDFDHATMQYKSGVAPGTDVDAAAAALAEANAQVALHRQEAISAAGGDTISALRKELIDLTIAQQERDAELTMLKQWQTSMEQGEIELDQLGALEAQLQRNQTRIYQLQAELEAASR